MSGQIANKSGDESSHSKALFLSRVALAVRAGNKHRETTRAALPANVGYIGAGSDPIGRLFDELSIAGACPFRVHTRDEAGSVIRSLIDRFAIRRAVINAAGVLDELAVAQVLREAEVEVSTTAGLRELDESARRDLLFAADLGVAAPDWAIAETGTLAYAADSGQARSTTLLPPVHLAIVDSDCVLADLVDLPARLASRSVDGVVPRNVVLVTGPSKTGDIELKLTTGVHGPGEVHVLIWDRK
jgi:L-lactate utilization protein LutC